MAQARGCPFCKRNEIKKKPKWAAFRRQQLYKFSENRVLPSERRGETKPMSPRYPGKESNISEHCSSTQAISPEASVLPGAMLKIPTQSHEIRSSADRAQSSILAFLDSPGNSGGRQLKSFLKRDGQLLEHWVGQHERNAILKRWTCRTD